MTLTIDGRKTDDLPGHAEFDQRLRELYPSDFCTSLRLVNYESAEARITGYAGLPTHSRSDRSEQYLFVNGRPTGAAMLAYAVREAYRGLLAKERHPQLFLFISINPALVDVNVHPTKKEVRFHNVAGVRNTVIAAIRKGLAIEAPGLSPSQGDSSTFVRQDFHKTSGLFPAAGVFNDFYIRPQKLPITGDNDNRGKQSPQLIQTDFSSSSRQDRKSPWSWIRILGEVCGIYVVMETEDGLVLMDPHAAHERILYEKLMARINDGEMNSHSLLLPETIEFPGRDAMILKRNMDALKKIGFGIAEFGGDSFVVDAVPACLSEAAPGRLLRDIISCMEEDGVKSGIGPLMEEKIAQAACKSAVKAHKSLSHKEIEALVSQLSKMEMPYTCPHGRPTLIHISRQELNKKFGRA